MTSVGPPGGNPTTTRTGRFGYPCANDAATPDSNNAAARNMRKLCFTALSLGYTFLGAIIGGGSVQSKSKAGLGYFFNSGLTLASSSSNDIAPVSLSPLTKKVGVESTFSVASAYL